MRQTCALSRKNIWRIFHSLLLCSLCSLLLRPKSMHDNHLQMAIALLCRNFPNFTSEKNQKKKSNATSMQYGKPVFLLSDSSSNVITIRLYSGCFGKFITLVSTLSSLVTFKTTSLNWMSLVMRQLILVWWISRSNPRRLMVIIQYQYQFQYRPKTPIP